MLEQSTSLASMHGLQCNASPFLSSLKVPIVALIRSVSIWCLPLHWMCLHPTELYHTFTSLCLLQRKSYGGTPVLIVPCSVYHNQRIPQYIKWLVVSYSIYDTWCPRLWVVGNFKLVPFTLDPC